jgi:GT2 family glycosyltransferase
LDSKENFVKDPIVSIIIITRNRPFLLRHCIQRVLAQNYLHKEIIVVDSSTNGESEEVVARYPGVISVRLRGQYNNMPQARNEGIAASSGDIIAFIDDDSMVYPEWLLSLVEAYQDETIGAAGGRIVRRPEPYCDQISGTPNLSITPSGMVIAQNVDLVSTAQIEVDHLIGCNMSFRREALEQVGGFDPNYTLTNLREETDLCVRVKKAGWRIVFVPSITVIHISARAKTFFTEQPGIQFSNGRNITYFTIKHFGLTPRVLVGQFLDLGNSWKRAITLSGIFLFGVLAQMAGRVIGLGVGFAWLMSSKQRAAAAPKIERLRQSVSERKSLPAATSVKSVE